QWTLRRTLGLEQAGAHFDTQDAPYGVVEPFAADLARAYLREQARSQALPAVGSHEHVDACVESPGTTDVRATRDLPVAVPVSHDKAVESQALLENPGEESFVPMHLHTLPARVGGHDRLHPCGYRRQVAGTVNVAQRALAGAIVALVASLARAAVAQKVLRSCEHVLAAEERVRAPRALQARDHRGRIRPHDGRVLGLRLVTPPPANVARHGERGCERPVLSRHAHFACRSFPDAPYEVRVVH